ncbi:MAG: hypothetical protein AAF220_06675 [Pseudomonadota bacterium]
MKAILAMLASVRMSFISVLAVCAVLLMTVLPSQASADDTGWKSLEQPGAIALIRHALAPGTGDPANLDLND